MTLETPEVPQRSIQFAQQQMAPMGSLLCWMDFYANRPRSFSDDMQAAYIAELRVNKLQKRADDVAREALTRDEAKTVGGGARGR